MPVTVFGTIILDLIIPVLRLPQPGETMVGGAMMRAPGGKGANQALAACRAGAEVALFGAVGSDGFATAALDLLDQAGVDLAAVKVDERPTGVAAIAVDAAGDNLILVSLGANQAARADDVPDDRLGPGTIVLLQGELDLAHSIAVARRARALGGRVCLNLAPFRSLPAEATSLIDLLVLNSPEAAALGTQFAVDPGAAALGTRLGCAVVVTRGAQGAEWHADGAGGAVPALEVEVRDTVGAGDAFVGALAASLDRGRPLAEAVQRAAVAGSLACRAEGAQASLPDEAEIEAGVGRLSTRVTSGTASSLS